MLFTTIGLDQLDYVSGGFRWEDFGLSSNVEDRRTGPSEFDRNPGLGGGTAAPVDPNAGSSPPVEMGDPGSDLRDYVGAALGGPLTPSEDGRVVAPNGQSWEDPSANANVWADWYNNQNAGSGSFDPNGPPPPPPDSGSGSGFDPGFGSGGLDPSTWDPSTFDQGGEGPVGGGDPDVGGDGGGE